MNMQKSDFIEVDFTGKIKDGEVFDSTLKEELENHPESTLSNTRHSLKDSGQLGNAEEISPSRDLLESRRTKVFIGHGGDSTLRDQLELFLWRNGFRPVIVCPDAITCVRGPEVPIRKKRACSQRGSIPVNGPIGSQNVEK